jgi:hypothetical protein
LCCAPSRAVRARNRPRPLQEYEPILLRRNGGGADEESAQQIQDLIRSRFRCEPPVLLLRCECEENEDRSRKGDDLKDHDA